MSSNTEMQTNMIEMIYNKLLNREATNGPRIKTELGIKKMCGIDVSVELIIFWPIKEMYPHYASLQIDADDIWVCEDEEINQYGLFCQHLKIDKTIPVIKIKSPATGKKIGR